MATLSRIRPSAPARGEQRSPLTLLRQEMDDLIARFWDGQSDKGWFGGTFEPSVDVIESENVLEIRMDIPGMKPQDIDVQVHGNTLTIGGERKEEKEEKGKNYRRIERRHGSFSRTIALPCSVNEEEVAADYQEGVLVVKLPKCDEAAAKKVVVKG